METYAPAQDNPSVKYSSKSTKTILDISWRFDAIDSPAVERITTHTSSVQICADAMSRQISGVSWAAERSLTSPLARTCAAIADGATACCEAWVWCCNPLETHVFSISMRRDLVLRFQIYRVTAR